MRLREFGIPARRRDCQTLFLISKSTTTVGHYPRVVNLTEESVKNDYGMERCDARHHHLF
jgi:hypothetical protein